MTLCYIEYTKDIAIIEIYGEFWFIKEKHAVIGSLFERTPL